MTLSLIFCCTSFWGNHYNPAISVSLGETSAPVHSYFDPIQTAQVWRVSSPNCIFIYSLFIFPQMYNRIYIRAHRGPLQNSPVFILRHSWVFLAKNSVFNILANSNLTFLWFTFSSGVVLGHFPLGPVWFTQWQMMRSETDVAWPCRSPLMSLKLWFLLQPHSGRRAAVPWTLNFWICATVLTGTSSSFKVVLLYGLDRWHVSLISWDSLLNQHDLHIDVYLKEMLKFDKQKSDVLTS